MNFVSKSCIFALGLALLSLTAAAEGIVQLRGEVTVDRPVIRLSDVFEGIETKIDKEIAIAPAPGKSVTYDLNVLTKLSERYNLAWKPKSLADKSVLTRAATYITPDMIRDIITRKIKVAEQEGQKIDIQFDNRVLGLALPASESPVYDIDSFDYNEATQRFRGELVAQDAAGTKTQLITGHVVLRRSIPVLANRLPAGAVIGKNDIKWVMVDDTRIGEDVLTVASQIVGQELRREQAEGDRFRARDISAPRLVKRGEIVTLKVETPSMQITTQGRSLQDGAKGELIRVTNTRSNQVVEGIVTASGIVRVGALHKIASVE